MRGIVFLCFLFYKDISFFLLLVSRRDMFLSFESKVFVNKVEFVVWIDVLILVGVWFILLEEFYISD